MTIQSFIEKAIEGGWIPYSYETPVPDNGAIQKAILLDPLAWKAVGKAEGWKGSCDVCGSRTALNCSGSDGGGIMDTWLWYMHRMIDALAEGKTIEEYLATL